MKPETVIPKREKMSYLLANIGNIPLMTLLSTFFMIFYTDVIGLNPAALATLFLLSKLFDAISDPIMGYLLDKFPVTKMGKFRPMLILGAVTCSINYILLWFGPIWFPEIKYIIVYITYLLLGWTFDIMDISLNSLLPIMTPDSKQRDQLSLIKTLGYAVGGLFLSIIGPIIVASGTLKSYYLLIFSSVCIVLIFSTIGALGVKERVRFEGTKEENYNLKELLGFLTCKPVSITFLMSLISNIGGQIAVGANTYFYTYLLGDLKIMSTVTLVAVLGLIPGMILSPVMSGKLGKKKVYVLASFITVFGTLLRLLAPSSILLLCLASVINSFGSGLAGPLAFSIQADNTLYVQYQTGKRAEAAIASLSSFITKLAQGIGGAIPGYILAWTGYVKGALVQSSNVHLGIIICVVVLPALCSFVGATIFSVGYPMNIKQMK